MTEVFDAAVTGRLLETFGDEARPLVLELIGAFFEEGPRLVGSIRNGLAAGDAELVRRSAHSLKSSAATLGTPELEAACRSLENLARAGDLGDATPSVARVEAGYGPAAEALAALARAWDPAVPEASA